MPSGRAKADIRKGRVEAAVKFLENPLALEGEVLSPSRGRSGHLQNLAAQVDRVGLRGYRFSHHFRPDLPQGLHLVELGPKGVAAETGQHTLQALQHGVSP
jgi:hypothetical protein